MKGKKTNTTNNYKDMSNNIFHLLNEFRSNPRKLAHHLEKIKKYLDNDTNILNEPNKVQIKMKEGESAFIDAIKYLKSLKPIPPLEWSDNLARSAQEHVNDIGPKGLIQYKSSDGTEPEDRIGKFGKYLESLGENIDFGPNDEMGVIVSLTLDDGEQQRPHRDNLFKTDYKKIGIACGPHKTEFQMCVMDFAYDFLPKNNSNVNNNIVVNNVNQHNRSFNNNDVNNNPVVNLNLNENNNNFNNNSYGGNFNKMEKSSPYVKLSLDNDDFKNFKGLNEEVKQKLIDEYSGKKNINNNNMNNNVNNMNNNFEIDDEINNLTNEVKNINSQKKIVSKKVEIVTKILYTYEDGSTKLTEEKITHNF